MSEVVTKAVAALQEKMAGESFDGSAKFVIEDEGSVIIEGDTVREGDDATDVTLTADRDTFEAILSGDLNPTAAFMGGKLAVDGDMSAAMRLAGVLA
ncbi:sterol carrier family protein [Sagittula sp. P11]|jgi:putative sterol carrier protein|uniref:SCP2 sterol-binding domain-containing protein n=1 Tax=unclassified Sagittula TaxID=2624628 RepID=UPI000C2CE7F8|nr:MULTISPECIES: SCP2 sterol-binding domain-containing protein [unclassified Sagittula]AUC54815.1 sterol carrier family protein [Sagittula sp. P11]WHZ33822.1 SCP2 sterol-binding domain-containing protein [Sagittula sp. MA-2]